MPAQVFTANPKSRALPHCHRAAGPPAASPRPATDRAGEVTGRECGRGGQARIASCRAFACPSGQVRYVAAFRSRGVFISYRRIDAGPYARLLQVRLGEHLPGTPVFMDLDSIEAGVDFAEAITAGLDACFVLVALIGPRWLTAADEEGSRRLDDPRDYVRFEIRTALQCGVRVIPVLVDGAKPLRPRQLPHDLRNLARLSALEMSYDRYEYDESRLVAVIRKELTARSDGTTPTASATS